MADKENASDLIAGIGSVNNEGGEEVKNILIDLLKRETSNFSADFSNVLSKKLGQAITMSRIPRKSAAFKVLKQPHAPSVLVELGYMSNTMQEQEMMTGDWQSKVAEAIASAVQSYFSKRTAAQP
jgi:N-acetylmuramoyl-L-alanine amidase